jgi:hypothetical protein
LGKPERHLHGTIQVDGSGQLSLGLLDTPELAIQHAKAAVAMGHEQTHTEGADRGEKMHITHSGGILHTLLAESQ